MLDSLPPAAEILEPAPAQIIDGDAAAFIAIRGTVTDPNLVGWVVEVDRPGTVGPQVPTFVELKRGTSEVDASALALLVTALENVGPDRVRLRATDLAGHPATSSVVSFEMTGTPRDLDPPSVGFVDPLPTLWQDAETVLVSATEQGPRRCRGRILAALPRGASRGGRASPDETACEGAGVSHCGEAANSFAAPRRSPVARRRSSCPRVGASTCHPKRQEQMLTGGPGNGGPSGPRCGAYNALPENRGSSARPTLTTARFSFEAADLKLPEPGYLSSDDARRLVRDLFHSFTSAAAGPGAVPLAADLVPNVSGTSHVSVFEVRFFAKAEPSQTLRSFIVRQHRGPNAREAAGRERRFGEALASSDRSEVSCRLLQISPSLPDTLVYQHAGPDFIRLDERLHVLLADYQNESSNSLVQRLKSFGPLVTAAYDDESPLPQVISPSKYAYSILPELPPDFVLDVRGATFSFDGPRPQIRLLVQDESPVPATELTLGSLLARSITAASHDRLHCPAVPISFRSTIRYARVPRVSLREGDHECWLLLPQPVEAQLRERQSELVDLLMDASIVSLRNTEQIFGESGFDSGAFLSRKGFLRHCRTLTDLGLELRLLLRHRDMHCGNLLASKDAARLIDLGDVATDLVAVDLARLEISLWRKLIYRFAITTDEARQILAILAGADISIEGLRPEALLLFNAVGAIRQGFRDALAARDRLSELDEHFAYAVQVLTYLRYALDDLLDSADSTRFSVFAVVAEHRLSSFVRVLVQLQPRTETRVQPSADSPRAPIGTVTLADLWSRALETHGVVLSGASDLLNAIQKAEPASCRAPLTDLQLKAYQLCDTSAGGGEQFFTSPRHILLSGPTSCGKTTLAEMVLLRTALLNRARRLALYIAPTRALAQAKFRDLQQKLSGTVLQNQLVLSTGENTEEDHRIMTAQFLIACMVYEKANILFSRNRRALDGLGCVVIDELHMLRDLERGPLLELAIAKVLDARRRADVEKGRVTADRLRIVGISTEGAGGDSVRRFLSFVDPDSLSPQEPLIVQSAIRPVPVQHQLVLPGSGKGKFVPVPIITMAGDDRRQLSGEELTTLSRRIDTIIAAARGGKGEPLGPARSTYERLFKLLDKRCDEQRATGYRGIVFVPSKNELESVADQYRVRRHEGRDAPPADLISKLEAAAKSAAIMDTGHRLVLCAKRGVFIHHSEVETAARRLIEDYFSAAPGPNVAQIVFATETLTYGLNLWVTDVCLLGTRFFTQNRRRELRQEPLSACSFHNMAGRAGRLGRLTFGTANVYIFPTVDAPPMAEIISPYYSSVEFVDSVLFDREDKAVIQQYRERLARAVPSARLDGEAFTYPFVRTVLDALRHLSLISPGGGGSAYARVSLDAILDLLWRTLYAHQRLSGMSNGQTSEAQVSERDLFVEAIGAVLRDLIPAPLALVESRTASGEEARYAITPRGEAIIDTGTEITTVRPLLDLAQRLREYWASEESALGFPIELYLVAVVAQREAYRQCIRSTPEVAEYDNVVWQEDIARANRGKLLKRLVSAMTRLGIERPEVVGPRVRAILEGWEGTSNEFTTFGRYPFGLVDAILRLVTAAVEWIVGAERSRVREFIVGGPDDVAQASQLSGFHSFKEQASWKLVFLARMLGTSDGRSSGLLSPREERAIYELATRMRIGCSAEACRLIYQDYPESLSREEATALVASGVTADELVRQRDVPEGPLLSTGRMVALRRRIRREAVNRFRSLSRTWTAALGPGPNRDALGQLWEHFDEGFEGSSDAYYAEQPECVGVDSAVNGLANWETLVQGERKAKLEPGLGDTSTLGFRRSRSERGVECVLEDLRQSRRSEQVATIIGAQLLFDWKVLLADRRIEFAELLESEREARNLVIIACPWVPTRRQLPQPLVSVLEERKKKGQATRIVSAAATLVLLTAVVREFIGFQDLMKQLTASDGEPPLYLLSLENTEDMLLAPGRQAFLPSALRESLLNHLEFGFAAR